MTTGAALLDFDGTPTTVISLSETISDGRVVGGNTVFDNSTDKWPLGLATIRVQDTFGAAPTTGYSISLYMIRGEISTGVDSSGDAAYAAVANAAALTDTNGMEYCGSFVCDGNDEDFKRQITISLVGVREARFYIKNNLGQTLVYSSNAITVTVEGITYAPSA
jgi:hypothetical protein